MSILAIVWFVLIGVLLAGYLLLDGFDLGVGVWHLLTPGDDHRRKMLNAVGPFWDGNEVWLLTGGGAVFAAFPYVYASIFSALYLPLMLVLVALILRAVSVEYRAKVDSPAWHRMWDCAFGVGSIIPALLLGVAMGNVMRGLPLNDKGDYTGTFFALLNPFSLLMGVTGLAVLAGHGAIFLMLKSDGALRRRARTYATIALPAAVLLTGGAIVATASRQKHLLANYHLAPRLWAAPAGAMVALLAALLLVRLKKAGAAFVCTALAIVAGVGAIAAGLFPTLLPDSSQPPRSLTITNAASTDYTLMIMLVIAAIGVPIVLLYTIWIYWTFRHKTDVEPVY